MVLDPKAIFGIIISIVGLYWAFRDFQFDEFTNSLNKVNYFYLVLVTLFLWSSVWLRALRWRYLYRRDLSPSTVSLYRAELIGYFGNNVLPLRLGELLRAYLIGREWNISKSYVFGTVALERLLDMLTLVAITFLLIMFYPLEESLRKNILLGSGIILLSIIILFVFLNHLKEIIRNHRVLNIVKQMIDGLSSIKKDALLPVTLLSISIWGIYCLDIFLLQYAFHFDLSFPQVLMVLVLSSLALSIPSAPGMIGTFHASVKYTMVDLFGFAPHDGNSFAIFMHAYGYILLTFLGAYYFMKNQFRENAMQKVIDTNVNQGID